MRVRRSRGGFPGNCLAIWRAVVEAAHERGRALLGLQLARTAQDVPLLRQQHAEEVVLGDRVALGHLQAQMPRLGEAQVGADALKRIAGPREVDVWIKVARVLLYVFCIK